MHGISSVAPFFRQTSYHVFSAAFRYSWCSRESSFVVCTCTLLSIAHIQCVVAHTSYSFDHSLVSKYRTMSVGFVFKPHYSPFAFRCVTEEMSMHNDNGGNKEEL